jgi:von Willebrand factor type A domain
MDDDFVLAISDHKYLPRGVTEVQAVLTVTAVSPDLDRVSSGGASSGLAEVIMVDTSGSMVVGSKMPDARQATMAAVDALPDGSLFAIVAGHHEARMVYPSEPELAVAGPGTRAQAHSAVKRLRAYGGTAIGQWLGLARTLLIGRDEEIRHVTLLTDGQNGERAAVLARALDECHDVFQCDARGIGDDWNARELIGIAEALRGQARAVTEESNLADEFRSIVETWTTKSVRALTLRIRLSSFAELRHLRQVHPVKADLDAHLRAGDGVVEVDTGAWSPGELREYSLRIGVGDAGDLTEDLRAARIDVFTGDAQRAAPELVLVRRTTDDYRSVLPDPKLREYSQQEELSRVIGDGCGAFAAKRRAEAEKAFARAVQIARAANDRDMLARLARIVTVTADGTVRLRPDVRDSDLLMLETESQFSQLSREERTGPDRVCRCGYINRPGAKFCQKCRERL